MNDLDLAKVQREFRYRFSTLCNKCVSYYITFNLGVTNSPRSSVNQQGMVVGSMSG